MSRRIERRAAWALGFTFDEVDELAQTELRASTLPWVVGLRTRTGRDRVDRVRACGSLRPALVGDALVAQPWRCRDRACAACMRTRAREHGAQLRLALGRRQLEAPDQVRAFVTLTQPKRHEADEGPGEAISRWLASWRALTHRRGRHGARWHALVAGAVRAVEVTYSRAGTTHGGHVVAMTGYHAHGHLLVELRPGATLEQLRELVAEVWCDRVEPGGVVPGLSAGALRGAQVVDQVDERRIGQLAKYVSKPFAISDHNAARRVFEALVGRRMLEGLGSWRRWRRWADEAEQAVVKLAVRMSPWSLGKVYRHSRDWSLDGGVPFPAHPGSRDVLHLRAREVWARLEAWAVRRHAEVDATGPPPTAGDELAPSTGPPGEPSATAAPGHRSP